ncbi:DUF2252 family protein [Streptomyces sp. NPDC001262]|uniref:DUF2252 family protein n=1 Tax=unclassified Streptomyces TaxID=2593676 RepID=UPI00368DF367
MTGALLARAHAHTADPLVIGAYCGKGEQLGDALADFAVRYADRTEADHAELLAAVRGGRIAAETGVWRDGRPCGCRSGDRPEPFPVPGGVLVPWGA